MSDCLLYLIRFADMCRLDFCNCVERKILYNGIKYPPKHCKGSSEKYTSYTHITNHWLLIINYINIKIYEVKHIYIIIFIN